MNKSQAVSSTAAISLLPLRKSAYFPHKKWLFSSRKSSDVTFSLLRYAPPSFTMRLAADLESTTPVAASKSTHVGNSSFAEMLVRGNSAIADESVPSSRSVNSA